jgi:uncharacterized protein YbjT (DUF2867 family)
MNLFILGATGGTGSEVIGQALERGHQVTAFVRSPEKIAHRHDRLRIVTGPSPGLTRHIFCLTRSRTTTCIMRSSE